MRNRRKKRGFKKGFKGRKQKVKRTYYASRGGIRL